MGIVDNNVFGKWQVPVHKTRLPINQFSVLESNRDQEIFPSAVWLAQNGGAGGQCSILPVDKPVTDRFKYVKYRLQTHPVPKRIGRQINVRYYHCRSFLLRRLRAIINLSKKLFASVRLGASLRILVIARQDWGDFRQSARICSQAYFTARHPSAAQACGLLPVR
jgi:hypothetical protein